MWSNRSHCEGPSELLVRFHFFFCATVLICRFRAVCLHAFASLIYSTHSYWKKKTLSKCHLMFLVKILQIYQALRHLNGVSYFPFQKICCRQHAEMLYSCAHAAWVKTVLDSSRVWFKVIERPDFKHSHPEASCFWASVFHVFFT